MRVLPHMAFSSVAMSIKRNHANVRGTRAKRVIISERIHFKARSIVAYVAAVEDEVRVDKINHL